MQHLQQTDPELYTSLEKELSRQRDGLEMIPSENFVSPAVLEALGSTLTNKYSEGFPGKRYYGGNEFIDEVETLAQERAKKLFGFSHANVQPYSGSPANQAICFALLEPGEKLMGMNLLYGGHLTHGWKVNFSGVYYNAVQYPTGKDGYLDYDVIEKMALAEKPKLLFVGATAYPRLFDFERLSKIAKKVDAFLVADVSHISGLIVAGAHPSPAGYADVMMTTTHKTLRGPRGAIILTNGNPSTPLKAVERTRENLPTLIDRAVFPGLQGGPHNHQTAAIAVALKEAATEEFKAYGKQIVKNTKVLEGIFAENDIAMVTGGSDNHLLLLDLTNLGIGGKDAEKALERAGITVNKNAIPFDTRKPYDPSGIRLGTPALTTRGFTEADMQTVGEIFVQVLKNPEDEITITEVKKKVAELTAQHPLYSDLA
ncbi:MAG: serine hydroxymethyltransferase [Patescibacteria group bacterium]|jgi:glycine hydroxymethyltransferase